MARAFLIQPLFPSGSEPQRDSQSVAAAVSAASTQAGFHLVRADIVSETGRILDSVHREIDEADVVIAEFSQLNQNVMYELGLAHGANKPIVLLATGSSPLPFDLAGMRILVYDPSPSGLSALEQQLRSTLELALNNPDALRGSSTTPEGRGKSVFISYSHRDAAVLARLLVHLRPLEKIGLVDVWNDTRIEAGADWQEEVHSALEAAAAAVLLVSADFLASEFIVDNELPPLLESAETNGTRIIPVIVKPCRYTRDPALRRLQAINDPARPLAALADVEQEAVFDTVALAVERAVADRS